MPPAGTGHRVATARPAREWLRLEPCRLPLGVPAVAVARLPIEIDRSKLRAALRTLPDESLRAMLNDAIEALPADTLRAIASQYFDLRRLRPDRGPEKKGSLLADVTAFEPASPRRRLFRGLRR